MRKLLIATCLFLAIAFVACAQSATLQTGLVLKYLVQLPAEKSAHPPVIILLHGYGSNEQDLFGLASMFPKSFLIISVRAPDPLPGGAYQWYASAGAAGKRDGNKTQLEDSRKKIETFLAQVIKKYNADPGKVYLAGFSQGAIMSYEVGLTAPDKIRGIAVLSGMIFESLKPMVKVTPALKKLKIFIAHGTADERIPFTDGKAGDDYLKSIGLTTDFHQYAGMGHTISNDVMSDLLKWLK